MKAILLLAGLAACAPTPAVDEPAKEAICSVEGLNDAVGKPYSADLVERTRIRSGSKTVRVIRPGMAVTMDYRIDRLNIDLDEKGIVTRLHCG
jgi:hypothetical protein